MQKTITINGNKIKIVTKPKTYMGNFCGYRTKISCGDSEYEFHSNKLNAQDAMDTCYAKWVKIIHGEKDA